MNTERFIETFFRFMLDQHRTHVVELELTVIQVQALALLHEASVPATRLASYLGISAPAMTQLTDRLVRKQLIERRSDDGDRRSVMIALTGQGNRVVNRVRQRRSEVFAEALSKLDAADQKEVAGALEKLVIAFESLEARKLSARKIVPPVRSTHRDRSDTQTAAEPATASNEAGRRPVSRPVRRMRIEWD